MYKISSAIYKDGNLILAEKLSPAMEGKSLQLMILDITPFPVEDFVGAKHCGIKVLVDS